MRFSSEHQWFRVDGEHVVVGISDYAQDELGDVVFVDLPAVGAQVTAGQHVVTIESVKAVSEISLPLDGTVAAINTALEDQPELVNSDPTAAGWLLRLGDADAAVLETLMDAVAYDDYIADLG